MNNRKDGKKQVDSARKAKISVRSGRDIENGKRKLKKDRTHKTRKDPFHEVWETTCIPLLKKGVYQATIIMSFKGFIQDNILSLNFEPCNEKLENGEHLKGKVKT